MNTEWFQATGCILSVIGSWELNHVMCLSAVIELEQVAMLEGLATKIMRVFFILFVLLNKLNFRISAATGSSSLPTTNPSNGNANSPAGSRTSLESVYEELSIVNRIINAVFLQNVASTTMVKHEEVVSELLKVRQEDFTELINLTTQPVLKSLEQLFDRSNDSGKQVDAKFLTHYENFNEVLKNGNASLEMWRSVSTVDFRNVLSFNNLAVDKLVQCGSNVLQVVSQFYKMEKEANKPEAKDQVKHFLNLKMKLNDLAQCLKNEELTSNGDADSMLESMQPFKDTKSLKDMLVQFFHYKDFLNNYNVNFQKLSSEVDRLDGTSLTGNVSGIIRKAVGIHKKINDPNVQITIHLMSGRENSASDLTGVLTDIRSSWFREKIARGKDVEPLAVALTPIHGSAMLMQKLGLAWNQVNEVFKANKNLIESGAESLEKVVSFGDPKTTSAFLAVTKTKFDSCRPKMTVGLDTSTNDNFEQANGIIEDLFTDVETIKNTLDSINSSFDSSKLISYLRIIEKTIPSSIAVNDVESTRSDVRAIHGYAAVMSFFGHVGKLYDAQKRVSAAVNNFKKYTNTSDAFLTIKSVLQSTGLIQMLQCYEGANLDTTKFGKVVEFVQSMYKLSNAKTFNATKVYLMGIKTVQSDYLTFKTKVHKLRYKRANLEPVLKLKNPQQVSIQLAEGLAVIREMVRVQKEGDELRLNYSSAVLKDLQAKDPSEFWKDPNKTIMPMLDGIATLEKSVSVGRSSANLTTTWNVFTEAEKVPGIPDSKEMFGNVRGYLETYSTKTDYQSAIDKAEKLKEWDLDFASHQKALGSAFLVYNPIAEYFDDVFGFKKPQVAPIIVMKSPTAKDYLGTVGICVAVFLLMIIGVIIGYGFTKNGKMRYKNTYLYYFPDYEEFERRWRYSLFLDRENGENALVDASREVNPENVEIALKKGAYIDVYNVHGNTPLHMATNRGFVEIVELLIRNGADRTLLNCRNKLPEQCIPENYKELRNAGNYSKIMQIYEKHRNKKYRIQVPRVLATHMFHIFIEKRTDDNLTNSFMEKYPGITSEEPLITTTHCVCRIGADGALETDDFELLSWIFFGVIMVKDSWMEECLRNSKAIREDHKFLVEHVLYRGSLYQNCVLHWSLARSKGTMPYLCGVRVAIVMSECPLLLLYTALIRSLGGEALESFPDKEDYTPGSHPYLHTNRGPIFVIHDGKTDLSVYQKDPMFSLFTEPEFIALLLKREMHQDTSPNPIPILRVAPTQ